MPIVQLLFVVFLVVPLVEIYLLIKVGGLIGALPTVFLVVFTAVVGAALLRQQGLSTFRRVQLALSRGELPTVEMIEGAVLLVCGALLLTPGFFTDAVGFLGLVPPLRRAAIVRMLERGMAAAGGRRRHDRYSGPRTLEGDFRRDDD